MVKEYNVNISNSSIGHPLEVKRVPIQMFLFKEPIFYSMSPVYIYVLNHAGATNTIANKM